jgi:hypothetical protein
MATASNVITSGSGDSETQSPETSTDLDLPENLLPSIAARHDVVGSTGKLNPRRS